MTKAYVALVLNAHLPFVRRPEYESFLEERWFFEALSESYLPLLRLFRRLDAERLPFRMSLCLSPTLCAMLGDGLLCSRYIAYLESQIELARAERHRLRDDPACGCLAAMYERLFGEDLVDFRDLYGRDLLSAFDYFYKRGRIELLTSAATGAFLPLYRDCPGAVEAQIETAIISHRHIFGKQPEGLWLPQLGWYPGLGSVLKAYNIRYTLVSAKGALLGDPTPQYASFAPVVSPEGLTLFPRDQGATKAVWSDQTGYPADSVYRDFYRDIGFDLGRDYLAPYTSSAGERIYTGFKYWAVTGGSGPKRLYDPAAAMDRSSQQAAHFLSQRAVIAARARAAMDRPPLMVCSYDAELFGHWWFEGPAWLEALFRAAAAHPDVEFVTLSDYHKRHPENQCSEPEFSSWSGEGYGEAWLNADSDWIYRHIFKAVERMRELAERFHDESGLRERILNQGAREVLLSMCSDWALLMHAGTSSRFAQDQVERALSNFGRIYEMLCANTVDTEWITTLEKRDNLFPSMNYRIFRPKR